MVFAACMQHCLQSNVTHLTHVERVESVLCIKWPLAPPRGKAFNAMSKGLKEIHYNTISCNAVYVKGVKRHSKYAIRAHSILCMLKHVKRAESQYNF